MGQVLKSWIKEAGEDISNWRATWQHIQVLHCNHAITCKHSAHCTHFWINQGIWGDKTHNVQIGTIRWQWEDDQGMIHDHTILDLYYILDGQVWILSPQHWMQKNMSKQ